MLAEIPKHVGFTLRARREGAVAAAVVTAVLALGLSQTFVQTPGLKLASSSLAIHVAGNHLVDASGATVTLHGVDLSATEFACDEGGGPTNRGWGIYGGYPLDQASTYAAMAAWHVQVVRVPLNEDCWLNVNGVNPAYGGANYQAAIAAEVGMINQAGMTAVLDLHWSAPGQYAAIDQQPMADADHSITFWSQVATAYRNDPSVIYDLYNEPFLYGNYFTNPSQDPWLCWLNGCSLNQFVSANQIDMNGNTTGYLTSYTWNTAGMQTLINTIRATGSHQPVLVNGLDWANDDSGWLAHAPVDAAGQMIVGAHIYPGETCQTASCWDSVFTAIDASYPVLVGETGDHTSPPVAFLPTFLPYADSHGWSYLAWTWDPWTYLDDVLITGWNGTPNAGEGAYYQQHLLSIVPNPPTPSAPPTNTPTPTSTPSGSSTPTPTTTPVPTGGISGGLNVEPSMRPWHYIGANPQSWWCALPNCSNDFSNPVATINRELQAAKSVGAQNVRLEVPWPVIETAPGVYDWTRADTIFQAANAAGVTIWPDLMWTPAWAGGTSALNVPPTNTSDWTSFVTAFTHRYQSNLGDGIEIWNEPDSGKYLYNGSAQTYVSQLLNPAYDAIKSVNPNLKVIMGGPANDAGTCCAFLAAVISGGGKFDIASFHNYVGTELSEAAAYKTVLTSAGMGSKPIWLGEFGVQSSTCSGDCQSPVLSQVFTSTSPLAMADWYNLRDTDAWNCCPPSVVDSATWGIVDANFVPKPAFATLKALLGGGGGGPSPTPSPTATPTPSPTATSTPSPTATSTPSPTPTSSPTPSPSGEPSPTPSPSGEPSPTPSPTSTGEPSPTPSPTSTGEPSPTSDAPGQTRTPRPTSSEHPRPTSTPRRRSSPRPLGLVFLQPPDAQAGHTRLVLEMLSVGRTLSPNASGHATPPVITSLGLFGTPQRHIQAQNCRPRLCRRP